MSNYYAPCFYIIDFVVIPFYIELPCTNIDLFRLNTQFLLNNKSFLKVNAVIHYRTIKIRNNRLMKISQFKLNYSNFIGRWKEDDFKNSFTVFIVNNCLKRVIYSQLDMGVSKPFFTYIKRKAVLQIRSKDVRIKNLICHVYRKTDDLKDLFSVFICVNLKHMGPAEWRVTVSGELRFMTSYLES